MALSIWQSTIAAEGTPVEAYLASRGLTCSLPPSLRFHRGLKHPSGGIWPCMVALVTQGADDTPLAIHRTFLARDGQGKAPVEPAKMMLGPCRGGAVRLARTRRSPDGRRRHRDLSRGHAGDRTSGMGGAVHLRAAGARSARLRPRRDRSGRWRRSRRSGGARLRPALDAAGAASAHRPASAWSWTSTMCCSAARPASRRARNE